MIDGAPQSNPTPGTVPDSGRWTIDASHSFILFSVEHFTIAFARGIASGPTGTITIGENLADTRVEAVIDATTITTANPNRDEKMLGPDLLDVKNFPTIDFLSESITARGDNRYLMTGNLTLHGVTMPVDLDLVYNGTITDTRGRTRMGLTAVTVIRRDEFGAGEWGYVEFTAGLFMVPHTVKITLDIEAIRDVPEGQ